MLALLRTICHYKPRRYLAATGKQLSALMNGTRLVSTPKDIVVNKTARNVTSDSTLEKISNAKRFTLDTKLLDQRRPTTALSCFLQKKNTNWLIFHTSTEAFFGNKSKTPLTRCVNTPTLLFASQIAARNPLLLKRMFKSTTKNHHRKISIFHVVLMFSVGMVILIGMYKHWWLIVDTAVSRDIFHKTIQEFKEFQGISEPLPNSTAAITSTMEVDPKVKEWIRNNSNQMSYNKSIVDQAAVYAAADGQEMIDWRDFEHAQQDIELRNTAYHMSGHALVAYFTKDARPVESATIVPSGMSLGHVSQYGAPRTMSEVTADLDVVMGGLAAEKLIYGPDHFAKGAWADFKISKELATLIALYGESPSIDYNIVEMAPCRRPPGNNELDSNIKLKLKESYARAESLLAKHRTQLDILAEALLEQKTIKYDQLIRMDFGDSMKCRTMRRMKKPNTENTKL